MFIEDKLAIVANLFCIFLSCVNSLNSPCHVSPLCLSSILILSALVWMKSYVTSAVLAHFPETDLPLCLLVWLSSLIAWSICVSFLFYRPLCKQNRFGVCSLAFLEAGSSACSPIAPWLRLVLKAWVLPCGWRSCAALWGVRAMLCPLAALWAATQHSTVPHPAGYGATASSCGHAGLLPGPIPEPGSRGGRGGGHELSDILIRSVKVVCPFQVEQLIT